MYVWTMCCYYEFARERKGSLKITALTKDRVCDLIVDLNFYVCMDDMLLL